MQESLYSTTNPGTLECGNRLRAAREKAGKSIQDIATAARLPLRTVSMIESGDWSTIGASIFVKGSVRSYGRLLGVDVEPYLISTTSVELPQLVSHTRTPPVKRMVDVVAPRLVYVLMTAIIAVPVWMAATRSPLGEGAANQTTSLETDAQPVGAQTDAAQSATQPTTQKPVIASMGPSLPEAGQSAGDITLTFNGESWVQIIGKDGAAVEKGLIKAGETRQFKSSEIGRMTIGNVSEVRISQGGTAFDTSAYARSNVARIAVSSDGKLGGGSVE
jgi:cytoskeleton protein RodZ